MGDVGRVQQTLAAAAGLNPECVWSALSVAAYNDQAECVALLLRAAPPPCRYLLPGLYGQYLGRAARAGFVHVVEAMLCAVSVGVEVWHDGASALHVAGTPDVARALLAARASCAARTTLLETPLMTAAYRGDVAVVAALVAAKAGVNDVAHTRTALIAAAGGGRSLDVVSALVQAKADVHAPARLGRTCLHAAVKHQNAGLVDVLVAAKADVNAACTPLLHRGIPWALRSFRMTPLDVCYDMAAAHGPVYRPILLKLLAVKATTVHPRSGGFTKELECGWGEFRL